MTEKKNGDYEKPESHGEDEGLEGVSGGTEGYDPCHEGNMYWAACGKGDNARDYCRKGTRHR